MHCITLQSPSLVLVAGDLVMPDKPEQRLQIAFLNPEFAEFAMSPRCMQ